MNGAGIDVAIIGGGAAGLATAIFTLRSRPSSAVHVLDGARKLGAKILVSGGGRCNVTNTVVTERDFWGGPGTIVRQVLKAFPVDETVAFFRDLGVPLHEEPGGKLFPDSNRARDVLDALINEAQRLGVRILTDHRVLDVARTADGFRVDTSVGVLTARTVVLATGGRSLPKSGSDGVGYDIARRLGHSVVATTPALAPLVLDGHEAMHERLSGVAHDAELTVWVDTHARVRLTGALLWTHFGVSGPLALNASRHWERARIEGRPAKVTVNFIPGLQFDDIDVRLVNAAKERPRASAQTVLAGWLPASVASALVDSLRLPDVPLAQLAREDRRRLSRALAEWPLNVIETRGYNYAEVTAGGVPLVEIRPQTMESRVCPGLFLVGEILDADGRIGGFNFQWAWATARVAARGLSLSDDR